ncbi:MAG TPA: ABC transporter ATP-binding protein [Rhodocyclaceae bacterium]|nr:ABC transporter ATP-binding protein [Rhodocyclaceae bacterium]
MLQISDLGYQYQHSSKPALDGISLSARRGEVLGLLGPNGAGKTTLISHLAGLLAIQRGCILIDDVPLAELRAEAPTRIAVAPQEYAFYPTLSVRENLQCFGAASRLAGKLREERIAQSLAFAQLERFADTRAERLSGGLKRRLNLAIALLPSPALVLFDEPTVGVDPQSRAFILEAVKTLAREGTAVIYTTHYMEEIEAIADHAIIMDHGKVLRDGTLTELLSEGAARLRLIVGNMAATEACALLTRFGTAHREGEYIVVTLNPGVSPTSAITAVENAGARIEQLDYGHYNLEHLFMALTQRSLRDN